MRTLGLGVLAVALLTACGDATPDDDGAPTTSAEPAGGVEARQAGGDGELEAPPNIVVSAGENTLDLPPYTYCWGNGCADGAPPEQLPDIGAQDELIVEFPVPDWEFTASFRRADDACARNQILELERLSPTTFRLPPAGFAGAYDIDLGGRGDGGDVFTAFRWTTLGDGELPIPQASLAVLADHDGKVDSYGVEFSVTNLAKTPNKVEATITVTAAGGESLTFEPTLASLAPEGCQAVEGQLFWDGPADEGLAAADLGDGPFTYTVELTLDGVRHTATATWPDDEIPGNEPSVQLTFTPELPAL